MSTPFSNEIRNLRHARGLRVPAAAAAIGKSRATLYAWEAGEHAPDPEELAALIKLYACDEATELRLWRLRSGFEGEQVAA